MSGGMRQAEHVARMKEKINMYKVLVGKSEVDGDDNTSLQKTFFFSAVKTQ
jgi:hypothetical protein